MADGYWRLWWRCLTITWTKKIKWKDTNWFRTLLVVMQRLLWILFSFHEMISFDLPFQLQCTKLNVYIGMGNALLGRSHAKTLFRLNAIGRARAKKKKWSRVCIMTMMCCVLHLNVKYNRFQWDRWHDWPVCVFDRLTSVQYSAPVVDCLHASIPCPYWQRVSRDHLLAEGECRGAMEVCKVIAKIAMALANTCCGHCIKYCQPDDDGVGIAAAAFAQPLREEYTLAVACDCIICVCVWAANHNTTTHERNDHASLVYNGIRQWFEIT